VKIATTFKITDPL